MKAALLSLLVLLVLIIPPAANARGWQINPSGTGDAPTIQAGVDSAASGDTLWLASGYFAGAGNRDIYVYSKRVIFKAIPSSPHDCVIDQGGAGTCITFGGYSPNDYSSKSAVAGFASGRVEGIKIIRAWTAVSAYLNAAAAAEGCYFVYNTGDALSATGTPSGSDASISVIGCTFELNPGCAISCGYECTATVSDCHIYNGGQVLDADEHERVTITNCTVHENANESGALIECNDGGPVEVLNCLFFFNTSIVAESGCTISLECCDVYSNTGGDFVDGLAGQDGINGNFSADPDFCYDWYGGCSINYGSPCSPGNHPDSVDCGLIGAGYMGCGPPATEPATWGTIKSIYR